MDIEDAKRFAALAMELLKKATIQGADVGAYSECWNALNDIGTGAVLLVEKDEMRTYLLCEKQAGIASEAESRWKGVASKLQQIRDEQAPNKEPPPDPGLH